MKLKASILTVALSLTLAGTVVASQTFEIDTSHASIGFTVDHLVISKVRGDFRDFTGTIELDEQGAVQQVSSVIEVRSIDTGIQDRDDHLRGTDFFDIENYPQISFKSKNVLQDSGKNVLVGDLTIHGVTKEIALPFAIKGPVKGPYGKMHIGFEASTVINRKDYGLTWNKDMETGGLVVGEEIEIVINLEAIKI
jgi:polyisoprenoid-binding protein YceI